MILYEYLRNTLGMRNNLGSDLTIGDSKLICLQR